MVALVKRNDAWVTAKEAWVKSSGAWVRATGVYYKIGGVWTLVQSPPLPPPQPPTISLLVTDNKQINVGMRYPAVNDEPNVKKFRLLVSRTEMPSNQFGTGFFEEPVNLWPYEPFSDWIYDGGPKVNGVIQEHPDTSVVDHKFWPPGPAGNDGLPGGQWYYFAGWTQDVFDSWSVGTFTKVWVPQGGVDTGTEIHKEAVFQANASGYLANFAFVDGPDGDLITANANTGAGVSSQGVFFYSHKITNAIGQDGPLIGKVEGTIRLSRAANDGYAPSANVWMYWHDVSNTNGAYVDPDNRYDKTYLGTIAKGETRTFTIPTEWAASDWNTNIKGVGFGWSEGGAVAADSSLIFGVGHSARSGELNLRWVEEKT